MAVVNIFKAPTLAVAQKGALKPVQGLARQTLVGARRLAPRGSHLSGSGRRHPGVPLTASLEASVSVGARFVDAKVGSRANHAASVHQGSAPHLIVSKGKELTFRWERGQFLLYGRGGNRRRQVVFRFSQVSHPGNKRPVRYLTTPLHQFGRLHNFVVRSVPVGRSRLP